MRSRTHTGAHAGPAALLLCLVAGCAGSAALPIDDRPLPTPRPEALSLLNRPLYRPVLPAEREAELNLELDSAVARHLAAPEDPDAAIWLGRRLAYLGRYRDAIDVFTAALQSHPGDARIYRHRGHRFITTRQLELAIVDLDRAAALVQGRPDEIEPDGQPNPANVPTSTLHGNIHYHLALAHYLRRDLPRAAAAWERALAVATTDDMRVAVTDWLYLTYRRLDQEEDARRLLGILREDPDVLENHAYLRRLRLYAGQLPPDSLLGARTDDPVQLATYGYGVARWYLLKGDTARADALMRRILEGPSWAAFGYIAAEAEMAARRRPR